MVNVKPVILTESIKTVWQGVDHPEALAIDDDGTIWSGGEEGQVYCARLDEGPVKVATLPGRTLGFAIDAAGNCYCADMTGPGVYRITRQGEVSLVSSGSAERPTEVPNGLVFLPSGDLLFSDSGNWGENNGRIYRVTPDGHTTVVDTTAAAYPNGLALSPDGRYVVVVESTLPGVSLMEVGDNGQLVNRRILVKMPDIVPDGAAYDETGRLLISCWVPDAIYVYEPDGALRLLAHDPLRFVLNQPTNVAFVPGTKELVVANIGERFLSVLEHEAKGADVLRPPFNWAPSESP
jgi:gluconolactonase